MQTLVAQGMPRPNTQTHPYLNANQIQLQQKLHAPAQSIQNLSLEQGIQTISSAFDLTVWIDKRVARDTLMNTEAKSSESLEATLHQMASLANAELTLVDGVVLIAPSDIAPAIDTIVWRLMTSNISSNWNRADFDFAWELATPMSEVAKGLSRRINLDDHWTQSLEFDLWPEKRFTHSSRLGVVSCILASMDHRLDWDASQVAIVPITNNDLDNSNFNVEWVYTPKQIEMLGKDHCRDWRVSCPRAIVQNDGVHGWKIQATPREHRQLILPLVPKKQFQKSSSSQSVYTGTLQGSVGYLLEGLGKTLQIEFYPMPLPDSIALKEVQLEYNNATVPQMLDQLGQAAGLKLTLNQGRCEIKVLEK